MTALPSLRTRQPRTASVVLVAAVAWVTSLFVLADTPAALHTSNVGLLVVALVAGLAGIRTARRHSGVPRRFWTLLGAGVLSWAAGQAVWTWYESVLGQEVPFPSPADIGYLGLPPLAAAALSTLPMASPTLAGRVRTILDGLIVATSLLLTSWLLVLGPAFRVGGIGTVSQTISLAYPAGDVVVLTMVLYAWSRSRQRKHALPVSLPLVGTGLAAFAVSDSGFTYLTNAGLYSSGSLIDLGWFVGFALLLLAALRGGGDAVPERAATAAQSSGDLLPYAAVAVALSTSVVEYAREGYAGEFTFWVRTSLVALLVARQILTLRENGALTRDLERRVAERTAELTASRQRFSALAQHSSDLVTVVDQAGTVTYQSESSARVLGYDARTLLGRCLCDLMDPPAAAEFLATLQQVSPDVDRPHTVRSRLRHATGRECQVEITVTNLLDNPDVAGLVLNTRDVTDRVRLEDQLTRQAFTDALTGLPNKSLFTERLEHAMSRRSTGDGPVTVLFLDLDGFKAVNDTLGHGAGDLLLVDVAERLRSVARPGDTVARFGGDEFAVLVDDAHDQTYGPDLAQRVVDLLDQAFHVQSEEVYIAASIGIASLDVHASTAEQVLRNADLAMYQAKAAGKGTYAVYQPSMHAGLVWRVRMEADLRRALENDQLFLHYQPIVAMSTGRITGVEALVRWRHPEHGVVPPGDFIPLAESSGLIRDIGLWVLREACRQAVAWQATGAPLRMSVNLSGQQILQPDLVERVAEILAETGLAARNLTLEMTESVLIDNSDDVLATLLALRDMGVSISLDDFGTGYSSLSYLHRFPIDTLKIDRSFVERLSNGGDAALIATILALALSLGMETVAEGIENAHQARVLRRQGCATGQGFHYSRPVPAAEIGQLLREQVRRGPSRPTLPAQKRGGRPPRYGGTAGPDPAPARASASARTPAPAPVPVASAATSGARPGPR